MKRGDVHITGLGWLLLVGFPVLLVVSFIGPRSVQGWAFFGCALIALVVVLSVSGMGGRRHGSLAQLWADRVEAKQRDEARERGRSPEPMGEADADEQPWSRESTRREEHDR